ncbi:MAG: hypothetical protein AMK71_04965 [Nitrospira bacterium SG8_35_4]|nr:MAG: hypothetical protein AMK71_04965 [Nitrospira bacterium SG8_35_4]
MIKLFLIACIIGSKDRDPHMHHTQQEMKNTGTYGFPHKSVLVQLVIIIILSIVVYSNSLLNDFVYDDFAQIVENYGLRDLGNIGRVFFEDVWSFMGGGHSNYYRPLMHATYMINVAVFGLQPWGFHLVNILFHAGVSVLAFFVASRLFAITGRPSSHVLPFITALLFAVHPIHTEVVSWIACFPELSFTLFYLWSFYFYMGAVQADRIASSRQYSLSLVFFFLATFCKETALSLPLMLAVYDYCSTQNSFKPLRYVKRYIPFFFIAILYFAMRTIVLSEFAPLKRHSALSAYEYFINVFPLFAAYLKKLVLPLNLNVYYVFHPISSLLTTVGIFSLVVTLSFIIAAYVASRKNKLVFFNLMIIVIPLLPVLYIPALGENTFTERYLYLPSFGFVFLVALLVERLSERKPPLARVFFAAVLALACLYSVATVKRNMVWKNELTLWTDAVQKSPDGVLPHMQLGIAYSDQGDIAKALEQYQAALRINPEFADAYTNIGLLFRDMGMVQQALDNYLKALMLDPSTPVIHNNIGVAYEALGMLDKAIASFRESLRINSQQPGVYNNLGNAYAKKGKLDMAIQEYRKALQIQDNNADAYNNLGIAFARKGMPDEAIVYFRAALEINPDVPGFHNNIANAYMMKGLPVKAEEHRQKARNLKVGL